MNFKVKLNKTMVMSLICMLLGVVTIATAIVFNLPFSKSTADIYGGASQGTASHSGAHTVTSGDFISNGVMAYRIYFAENCLKEDGKFGDAPSGWNTYEAMYWYATLAIYNVKNWEGGDPYAHGTIFTWTPQGLLGEKAKVHEAKFNDAFGGVFNETYGNLPAIDLQGAITGTEWTPFIKYCSGIRDYQLKAGDDGDDGFEIAFNAYMKYIYDHPSELQATSLQRSAYNELKEIQRKKEWNKLMLVCEPVFVSQTASHHFQYTISLSDYGWDEHYPHTYGGHLYDTDNAGGYPKLIRRVPKLNTIYTDFEMKNGNRANPEPRWYGFFIFTKDDPAFHGGGDALIPTSINLNLQYKGDLQRGSRKALPEEVNVSIGHTITPPSSESDDLKRWLSEHDYLEDLKSWDGLNETYDAESHNVDPLYMAGTLEWKTEVFKGNGTVPPIPRADGTNAEIAHVSGACRERAFDNLLLGVADEAQKTRVRDSSLDYMFTLFGNLKATAIDDIVENELFITNSSVVSLQVGESDILKDISDLSGKKEKMQEVEKYINDNLKISSVETAVPSEGDSTLAWGSTIQSKFYMQGLDLNHEIGTLYQTAYNASNLTITGITEEINLPAEGQANGYAKYQDTPQQTQELLGRIEGCVALSSGVTYKDPETEQPSSGGSGGAPSGGLATPSGGSGAISGGAGIASTGNRPLYVTGGDIMVGITTMEKRTKVFNYLAFTRIASTGGETSPAEYQYAETGRTYDHGHTTQVYTTWYVNSTSAGSTIRNAGEDSNSYMIVWKNNDLLDKEEFSFQIAGQEEERNNTRDGAKAITEGIADWMQNNDGDLMDDEQTEKVKQAFKETTGVEPLSVVALGSEEDLERTLNLGSTFGADNKLSGYSVLVITTGGSDSLYSSGGGNLPAHMLNIFSPSSNGMRPADINKTPKRISFRKKDYDGTEREFLITDMISGDLYDLLGYKGLYYNEMKGTFGESEDDEKWFDYGEDVRPSYAYILPRSLWGDLPTICNYRGAGMNSTYTEFAEMMTFPVGDTPQKGITCNVGANIETIYPDTKHDIHKFYGQVWWWRSENDDEEKEADKEVVYDITHTMDKYTCMDKPTGELDSSEANILYDNVEVDVDRDTQFTYKTALRDQSESTLKIYPEVNMLMQYAPYGTIESRDDVETVFDMFVMGEKQRSFKPVSLRGIVIDNQEQFNGQFTSDTMAVGSRAKALQINNLPVTYTGGNINLHVDGIDEKFKLLSYSIDFDDEYEYLKNRFDSGNSNWKPEDEHTEFVNGTLRNLGVDITLDINENSGGTGTRYRYNNFNTMMGAFKVASTENDQSFKIEYRHGDVVKDGDGSEGYQALIADIAEEYDIDESDAEQVFEHSGMIEVIQKALESSEDIQNASHSEPDMEGRHWYDEQTSVLCVRKYKSIINVGDIALSDKLDITLGNDVRSDKLKQSGNRNELFANRYFGRWYVTMYLKKDIEFMSADCGDSQYQILYKEKPIENADFIVSDATTNDMRN